jgi:hyperosmotically inducible protein
MRMAGIRKRITVLVAALALTSVSAMAAPTSRDDAVSHERVRKELVTLPYYGVFDNLAFEINGSTVTLYGQVVRPTTKSDAARRIKRLSGVENVVNKIEVLPLSRFDDSIRIRAYRAVFGTSGLYRYAQGANPSVHIVVDRGHITLEGVVDSAGDRNLAYIAARGVPGAFSVTNNLKVKGNS